jgi:hypothetical protein
MTYLINDCFWTWVCVCVCFYLILRRGIPIVDTLILNSFYLYCNNLNIEYSYDHDFMHIAISQI